MFRVENGNIIIDADIIGAVPAFGVLYRKDPHPEKKLALAKLKIIYHLVDLRSPYAQSSTYNRLTKIVMDLFNIPDPADPEETAEVMKWFEHYYVPYKINKPKKKRAPKEGKAVKEEFEEEEVLRTDEQFERAIKQYTSFLNLIPEHAMEAAAQDAVHRLAEEIKDPKTVNGYQKLQYMNQAIKDMKEMRELVKVEEERQRSTKGGHSVRKREDPSYILSKSTNKV